jgi:hypothetical protein
VSEDSEVIKIDLDSDVSGAERATARLQELERETQELRSAFEQGNVSTDRYNQRLKELGREAGTAQRAVDKLADAEKKASGARLTGADRTKAKAQFAFAGANLAQDVIQGGPASGINNILGMAGNGGIKSLAGEFVAAAGGVKVLVGALGTIAVAASAAFLTIDTGLKSAKLGWSDLGDVIDEMAGGGFSETSKVWGDNLGKVWEDVKGITNEVADYWTGWNEATEAVKQHKDEIERSTQALEAYKAAQKDLKGIKSDAQVEAEKVDKLVGNEMANLGGDKGLDAVLDKLAEEQAGRNADKIYKQEYNEKDKDGKETGKVLTRDVTGKELAKEGLTQDFRNATTGGNKAARDILIRRLKESGYDTSGIEAAQQGRDLTAEKKEADRKAKTDADHAARDAERKAVELSRPLQDRYNLLTASGQAPDEAGVRRQLERGGSTPEEAKAAAGAVLKNLQEGFADEIRKRSGEKGLDAAGAAKDLLEENADKAKKEQERKDQQAKTEAEKRQRDAGEKADKLTAGTGFDARARTAALGAMLGGGGREAAEKRLTEQIRGELEARGMGHDEATRAAADKAKDVYAKTRDDVLTQAMEPKELRATQHLGAEDFGRSVESAASDTMKQTLDVNKRMEERLVEIARNTAQGQGLAP